jgi:mercuric ion transport protein
MTSDSPRYRTLTAAALAAVGASACCVGPLVLLSLGISGAWIGRLTALEPVRPYFAALTLVFLALAFQRLYRSPKACATDQPCALPQVRRRQRWIFWVVAVVLVTLLGIPFAAPWFY